MSGFPKAAVTVTLTGEEWTAVLTRMALPADALSPYGRAVYRSAQQKLADQIGTASDRCAAGVAARPQLISYQRPEG